MIIAAEPSFSLGNCRPPQIDQLCRGHLPSASQFSLFHHRLLIFQTFNFFLISNFKFCDFPIFTFHHLLLIFLTYPGSYALTPTRMKRKNELVNGLAYLFGLTSSLMSYHCKKVLVSEPQPVASENWCCGPRTVMGGRGWVPCRLFLTSLPPCRPS